MADARAQAATRWAAAGLRSFEDVRRADAEGALDPPLPPGRSLQRIAVEHAEEVRCGKHAQRKDGCVLMQSLRSAKTQLSQPAPREDWAPIRAVCEQARGGAFRRPAWHACAWRC